VRTAIRKHLGDFIALTMLFAVGVGAAGYMLAHQRLRFPLIQSKPMDVKADFADAQAVIPGQGQTVRVAGVKIGDIGTVDLKDGHAVVTLAIDEKYKSLLHRDATALLRPKTGLKDMFIEVEPGSDGSPLMRAGDHLPITNTAPDIDPDEFLSALDTDTRSYLQLLINGAGKGLAGHGNDLRAVFKRFEPLHRDLARFSEAIAERRHNMKRLVHNYASLVNELSDKDHDLRRLVESSNAVFKQFAVEDKNIGTTVNRLPAALNQTSDTLVKVSSLAKTMKPALTSLGPVFKQVDKANHQVLPFVKEAAPEIKSQIRPFVRTARPYIRDLRPASTDLAQSQPDLAAAFHELNRFFNMVAYNPGGTEKLSGDPTKDASRDEGYSFWMSWLAHNSVSLFSTSTASGPYRRTLTTIDCKTLRSAAGGTALEPLLGLTNIFNDPTYCGGPTP
jgi:phospholipid/cholesterol/gamma-HCH transport system substrate-binding protein